MAVRRLLFFLAVINIAASLESTNSSVVKVQRKVKLNQPCMEEGFKCKSCRESVYCTKYPDDSFRETSNTKCEGDEFCNEMYGTCGQWSQEYCDEYIDIEFKCHSSGIFPDAMNCFKYHHCIKTLPDYPYFYHMEAYCINGWIFDPKTGRCSTKFEDKCPEIVPRCLTVGQSGPIERNPTLYYICMEHEYYPNIIPELFACPYNYVYETNGCVNKYNIGLSSSGLCNAAGSFYHPNDCKKYRFCTQAGASPVEQTCEYAHKFVPGKGCVPFGCENCWNLF